MSQQGADDWWQKLYEEPEAVPPLDPGDTLDSRYHSAASLTTPPGREPHPPRGARPTAPGPEREATRRPLIPPQPDRGPEPGDLPWWSKPSADPAVSAPGAGPRGSSGEPPRTPDAAPAWPQAPAGPAAPGVPGAGGADVEPPPSAPAGAGSVPPGGRGVPRDPREAGATGYGLGHVTVPPVVADGPRPPAGPERPAAVAVPGAPPAPPVPPAPPAPPVPPERPVVGYVGDRAPTYAAEPGGLPAAEPGALDELVPDTVLDGARHGAFTLRAASVRGDSARYRAEARRDFLLTARFGSGDDALVLVALAGGDRAAAAAAEAAAEVCRGVAAAVGRSRQRLADDIRAGRRDALHSGLQRLTDRAYGRLRARAAELGHGEDEYTAGLRVLLLPIDPECRTRVCFGAGPGGLFRLRAGQWQDLEPTEATANPDPDLDPAPGPGFRFRAAVARPGDILLLCSGGLADPMREEELLPAELAARWSGAEPPGLAAFLADTQLRVKGYADDRTAAAVWEA